MSLFRYQLAMDQASDRLPLFSRRDRSLYLKKACINAEVKKLQKSLKKNSRKIYFSYLCFTLIHVEKSVTFIPLCGFLENHTQFQTKMVKMYTDLSLYQNGLKPQIWGHHIPI